MPTMSSATASLFLTSTGSGGALRSSGRLRKVGPSPYQTHVEVSIAGDVKRRFGRHIEKLEWRAPPVSAALRDEEGKETWNVTHAVIGSIRSEVPRSRSARP